jgi:hypothetical protein
MILFAIVIFYYFSSGETPIRHISTIARTGVLVPLMIGSPLRISLFLAM